MELSEEQKRKAQEATLETKRAQDVDAFPVETIAEPSEIQTPTRSPGSYEQTGDWQAPPPQWPQKQNRDEQAPGSADGNAFDQALAELQETTPTSTDKSRDIDR